MMLSTDTDASSTKAVEPGTGSLLAENAVISFEMNTQEERSNPCISTSGSDRPVTRARWKPPTALVLTLANIVMFGLYYLLTMPASVRQHIKEVMPEDNFETRYELLFSMSQFPNIFFPFFGGAAVDRIGAKICILVVSFICFIGQVVASIGMQEESWGPMLAGRFLYGVGSECVIISIQAFLSSWFEKTRLGMALAINLAVSYTGYFSSFILSPIVANRVNVTFSFWLGAIVIGVSVLAALVIFVICRDSDGKNASNDGTNVSSVETTEDALKEQTPRCNAPNINGPNVIHGELPRSEDESHIEYAGENKDMVSRSDFDHGESRIACKEFHLLRFLKFSVSYWLLCISSFLQYSVLFPFTNIASGLLLERNLFVEPSKDCVLKHPDQCSSGYLVPTDGNPSSDGNGLTCPSGEKYSPVIPDSLNITDTDPTWDESQYVFSFLETSDVDCTDSFWSDACTRNYCDKQETTTEKAGVVMSIPAIVSVTTLSLFGHFGVDRMGLRTEMIFCAPILVAIAQTMLAFLRSSPIVPLLLMGFGHSLVGSSLWPSVPLTVSENAVGMAFGLTMSIQNIGLAVFPLIVAAIYNNSGHRYLPEVSIFFSGCAALAIIVGFVLFCWDRRHNGKLRIRKNLSSSGSRHITPSLHGEELSKSGCKSQSNPMNIPNEESKTIETVYQS